MNIPEHEHIGPVPGPRYMTDAEWDKLIDREDAQTAMRTLYMTWRKHPSIGDADLRTKDGPIEGVLTWCNGENAIFETSQGRLVIPFEELQTPDGKTYPALNLEAQAERLAHLRNSRRQNHPPQFS